MKNDCLKYGSGVSSGRYICADCGFELVLRNDGNLPKCPHAEKRIHVMDCWRKETWPGTKEEQIFNGRYGLKEKMIKELLLAVVRGKTNVRKKSKGGDYGVLFQHRLALKGTDRIQGGIKIIFLLDEGIDVGDIIEWDSDKFLSPKEIWEIQSIEFRDPLIICDVIKIRSEVKKLGKLSQLEKTDSEIYESYDVAFSFAGENREYVKKVAEFLKKNDIKVFYDDFEDVNMWGEDLVEYFDDIFRKKSRFCVIFSSKEYAFKAWPTHEKRSALAREIEKKGIYILPARFDDTDIPGIPSTKKYVDLQSISPEKLGEMIIKKLKESSD